MSNPHNSAKFSQQPEGARIEFLKGVVSSQSGEQRDDDDSEPPLGDEEVTIMREIVTADYARWVEALGLAPVPLDVYGYCKTTDLNLAGMSSQFNDPAARLRDRLVSLDLDLAAPPADALTMYMLWIRAYMAYDMELPAGKMWVPIGRIGP